MYQCNRGNYLTTKEPVGACETNNCGFYEMFKRDGEECPYRVAVKPKRLDQFCSKTMEKE